MADKVPSKIRAILQPDAETIDLIQTELPAPVPKLDSQEHLIQVYATAPCSGELLWAKNYPSILDDGKALVPCYDLSGKVVQAPSDSPFPPGTDIYTRTSASRTGNAREYTIALTSELARKPKSLDWAQAASVPLSAFTATQALFDHGGLAGLGDPERHAKNREKKLIVTGAAGGVGVWIVQLAREAGVGSITGVCGKHSIDLVRKLGATGVVDYSETSLKEWIEADHSRKADLIVDCVGGSTLQQCWYAVKDRGTLLSIAGIPEGNKPADCTAEDVKSSFFIMEPIGSQLDAVTELIDAGKCEPLVDSVWKFEDYLKAFEKLNMRRAKGKVILKVRD